MTLVVVVGDSGIGKTKFMHIALTGKSPLNIFTSQEVEIFPFQGCSARKTATFAVLPGNCSNETIKDFMQRAEALVILYNEKCDTCRPWLLRCTNCKPTTLPIMICCHNSAQLTISECVQGVLRRYITAEHTFTNCLRSVGLKDCLNRIVRRAKRELGSPVSFT